MFDIIIAFLVVSVADQVMLSSECLTSEEKKCVFPFKVKEKTHTGGTKEGDPDKRYIQYRQLQFGFWRNDPIYLSLGGLVIFLANGGTLSELELRVLYFNETAILRDFVPDHDLYLNIFHVYVVWLFSP